MLYCKSCGRLYHACQCGSRPPVPPAPTPLYSNNGTLIGNIDHTGVINAPGMPYHLQKADPFGNIPGTNLKIGPGGIIGPKPGL